MIPTASACVFRVRRLFKVSDPCGLHLRPAAILAKAACAFDADVVIQYGASKISGKSLLSLLTLGVGPGDFLDIIAEGADATQTIETLAGLGKEHAFMVTA